MVMVKQSPKITILNVDDNKTSRYAKSRMLRRAGFEVQEATRGSQALDCIQQGRPSLVLLDIDLPDINGLEVCRRIKNDPATASTLVLQVSASLVSSADKARGLEGGADAYLTEPIEPEELVATVKALLRLRQAEAALKTQEAFLRQVIDLNPNLIFAKDRQGRFTLANQAVAEVYGTTVEGLLGKTDADFTANPAEVEHFQYDDLEVMDSLREKFIPEETLTDAAGRVRWLQTVKRPIISEDGLAHQVLGVATDITVHKEDQAALLRLNETLEQRVSERTALVQLLQEITAAANEADSVEWALQFALDRICAYIGWPVGHVYLLPEAGPPALIPGPLWHLDPPEQFETFRQATEASHFLPGVGLPGQVLASSELVWINDVSQHPNFPRAKAAAATGLKAGFGFPIWAGEEIVAVLEFFSSAAAQPDGSFLEAVTQIGTQLGRVIERKRAEKRIRESERELTEAQQIAHLGSWQWDIASNKISWSDELYRIYGLAPQSIQITYEGFLELVHPDDRERVAGLIAAAYQNGQSFDYEYRLIRPDGSMRTLHAQGQVIRDEANQPVKMVGTGHDITERKEAEEQLRRLNTELEQRVNERTAQLEAANRELAEEIRERKAVEAALRASEKQMRLITDAAPALIAYIDADLRYRFNNRTYETWFGLSRADMAGRHVWEVLGQAAFEALQPYFEAALAGQIVHYEELAPYQSGARYIQATYTPDVDDDGRVRGIVVLVTDISERKQMEEALRESEARFRSMADSAPVMIWVTEADSSCTYLSKSWYDFTGQTPETGLGFGWLEMVHPDEREHVKQHFLAAAAKREAFQLEYRLRRKDGEHCWVLDSASARLDPQGSFLGHIGSIIEIHDRKQAELAQRLLAEAGEILGSSLDYQERLSQVAWLAVPHLADWCAVTLIEEDGVTVHNVAVAHVDPAKLALALEMQQRYPARPEELAKQARPWQHGQSELYPEIGDDLLRAGARDAEHYQFLRDLQMRSAIVAPLVAHERVLGFILFVWAESGNRYDQQDLTLAEELARRAAIAIEIAFAYEAEQEARQRAEQVAERIAALQAITAQFAEALTPAQVAEVVLNRAAAMVRASGGSVVLLTNDQIEFEIAGMVGYPADIISQGQRFPNIADIPMGDVIRSGQPLFLESRDAVAALYPALAETIKIDHESWVIVPLIGEDGPLGILSFSFGEAHKFHPEEQEFILTLARQCGQALERAHLYEAEQQARQIAEETAERIASLQNITAALSEAPTPAQVARVIINQGFAPLSADGGAITLLDESGHHLQIVDYFGYPPDLVEAWQNFPISPGRDLISDAIHTGQPIFIESLEALFAQYPFFKERNRSSHQGRAAVPLIVEDHIIGAIGLTFAQARTYSEDERNFLVVLAQLCAQALERARLYEVERAARAEAEASQQRLALLAEMRERNRLAQELHDTVAQALGYLNIKIGMAHTSLRSNHVEAAEVNLRELKQVISETYTDVREEIFNLRAKVLAGMSFMEVLDRYVDKYRRFYKLEIQLVQAADPTLFEFSAEVTSQLVRIIQEALINIRKHAQVNKATVRLGQEDDHIHISIEDQGQGFDLEKMNEKASSFGLQIMRERVESVGGSLEVHTAPGQGTRISVRYKK
jgi:PAS domain S-box-containing protein